MTGQEAAERTAETMARNDAVFRGANERIEAFAQSIDGAPDEPLPFLCECADVTCTEILRITGSEYEALRQESVWFATVPGHEGDEDWARIVQANERYAVIEKLGAAAEVAEELDPRVEGNDERA